ncbi:MAG: VCBS repeat-containing protein [Planctomycetota bacterium]|nr:MAG: VCBS repeat-containing protein [Planctomycetota bacterium]
MSERATAPYTLLAAGVTALVATACSHKLPRSVLLAEFPSEKGHAHAESFVVGDIDRDGRADVALICETEPGLPSEAAAEVFSPQRQASILTLRTGVAAAWRTTRAAAAGDTNADGWPDVLLAVGGASDHAEPGRVWLFSGRDASVLHRWTGTDPAAAFGTGAGTVGDLDGDRADDIWISAPQTQHTRFASSTDTCGGGFLNLYSGRTGAELFTVRGESTGDAIGESVLPIDDLDGDGVPELAVGSTSLARAPAARIFSGRNGSLVRRLTPPAPDPAYYLQLAGYYDADGDGSNECLLSQRGESWLVSPGDGRVLATFAHERAKPELVGDFDRDGTCDFVVCDLDFPGEGIFETSGLLARLHSGRDGRALGERFFGEPGLPPIVSPLGDIDVDGVTDLLIPRYGVVSGARMFALRP